MLTRKAGAVCCLTGLMGWDGSIWSGRGSVASCKDSSAAPIIATELPQWKLLEMLVPVSLMNPAAETVGRRLGSARGVAWGATHATKATHLEQALSVLQQWWLQFS